MKLYFTNEWLRKNIENEPDDVCISAGGGPIMERKMVLTQKEIDALQIAGFSSVTELLARYFELQREVVDYKRTYAVGSNKCQISEYRPNLYP